jgi:exodeoxyribonuclease VII large subunit
VALSGVAGRLTPGVLLNRLAQRAERVDGLGRRLPGPLRAIVTDGTRRKEAAAHRLDRIGPQVIPVARDRLEKSARLLETLSYRATLARGYAVVRDADGALVPKAEGVTSGAGLEVEFADGRVNVVASGGSAPPSKPRKAAAKKAGDQGAFDL